MSATLSFREEMYGRAHKLEGKERRFLRELGSDLKLKPESVGQILDVLVLKNQL